MVDIIRRKNVDLKSPDVSSGMKATANMVQKIGTGIGSAMENYGKKLERRQAQDREYQSKVEENLYKAQEQIRVNEQKAFDAADKLVATDRAGRLKNDLLRWNLAQRENNPSYIGTAEHEKRMRDEYARLSNLYGQGLGEAGREEFQNKTQSAVNDFISNDVKWAYQQKIKKGEESAKQIAETMNKTAGMYGANGDVEGFKEAHKENIEKLEEYAKDTGMAGADPALKEVGEKSMVEFYTNMAQTDPVKAKALLDSRENFDKTVPDDLLEKSNNIVSQSVNRDLNDKLILVNAGLENTKKDSPQHKQLKKQKKKIEKEIKEAEKEDYSEKSLEELHKKVSDAVQPVLEKSLGESALIEKKEHEEEKAQRFQEFMKLPTPDNLKWFEEDNQMSYAKPEENMTKLPDDFFSYGDQSTLKDYYDMYKGRYESTGKATNKVEMGLTDMLNDIGLAEDDAQIQFFDKIDQFKSKGMSEEDAIQKTFDANPNNKFGDVSTLKDFYDMFKGRYDETVKAEMGLTDMLNNIGLAEDDAQLQFFDKINAYKRQGMSENKAIQKVFDDNPNNAFGDVSTLKDFYDYYQGRYDNPSVNMVLSNANEEDLKRIDKLVSGGMSEEKAVEKVFNETEAEIARKSKQKRANELLENMMKYRENFGNVSMVEISDYKGTKQMFDDLKALAQTDSDRDGNTDNVLNKALVALNNAKQESISEKDFNNYQNIVNKTLFDSTYKDEINSFVEKTQNFAPKKFWSLTGKYLTTNATELDERMEHGTRDVLSKCLEAWNNGATSEEVSNMYRDGVSKTYDSVVSKVLDINMEQIKSDYGKHGFSLANIGGRDYLFKGVDSTGNPIWQKVTANGMSADELVGKLKKVGTNL